MIREETTCLDPCINAAACSQDTPFDVLVVGAGPHALALVSRLHEGRSESPVWSNGPPWSICVVDEQGQWLVQWRSQFSRLGITHLRSTMVLHPDVEDEYGLLRWAETRGRLEETLDVQLPGKYPEHDKLLERLQFHPEVNWRRPSATLFDDFCDGVVERLSPHTLLAGVCREVSFDQVHGCFEATVQTRSKTACDMHKINAFAVCFCFGSSIPNIPEAFSSFSSDRVKHTAQWSASDIGLVGGEAKKHGNVFIRGDGADAAAQIEETAQGRKGDGAGQEETAQGSAQIERRPCVVVVGGGLSSAQVALDYVSRGDSAVHVYLLSRKPWLVRDFDVPVDWVERWTEKYTALRSDFSGCSFAEKLTRIQSVRKGGSIPPNYFERLLEEQAKGRITLLSDTEIKKAELIEGGVSLVVENGQGQLQIQAIEVVLATGTRLAVDRIPCLEWLRQHKPIEEYGGAPAIQSDLRWAPGVDAFLLGAYAALQLGPDSVNLAGARRGSRLVARELWNARLRRWNVCSNGMQVPIHKLHKWTLPVATRESQAIEVLSCRSLQDEEEDLTNELGFRSSPQETKSELRSLIPPSEDVACMHV